MRSAAQKVIVKSGLNGPDGYEGLMFVIERDGFDYGLSRHENAQYADVWIHAQRIEPVRVAHELGLISVEGLWPA